MDNTRRRRQLGQSIRRTREKQGISQRKLSYMLGHSSHSYINDVENGRTSVGFDTICSVADALDVDVGYFFMGL